MSWQIIILVCALFLGVNSVVQKKILIREHAVAFLAASYLVMIVLALPLLFLGRVHALDPTLIFPLLIKSLFATLFFVFTTMGLRHLEVSEFGPLMNFSPIFLLFISITFLGENLTLAQLTGILLVIIGTYVIELRGGWLSPFKRIKENKFIHYVFLGLIFASLAAVMDRFVLTKNIDVDTFFFYNRLIIGTMLIAISMIFYKGMRDMIHVYKNSFFLTFLSGILYSVGDYLYFMAVAAPAGLISLVIPLKRSSTLISTAIGGELFHEKRLARKIFACLVMVLGAILIMS